jgi:hypothetical protein
VHGGAGCPELGARRPGELRGRGGCRGTGSAGARCGAGLGACAPPARREEGGCLLEDHALALRGQAADLEAALHREHAGPAADAVEHRKPAQRREQRPPVELRVVPHQLPEPPPVALERLGDQDLQARAALLA